MGKKLSKTATNASEITIPTDVVQIADRFWRRNCESATVRNEIFNAKLLFCVMKPLDNLESSGILTGFDPFFAIRNVLKLLSNPAKSDQFWALIYQCRAVCKAFNLNEDVLIKTWKQISQLLLKTYDSDYSLVTQHALDICALYCISTVAVSSENEKSKSVPPLALKPSSVGSDDNITSSTVSHSRTNLSLSYCKSAVYLCDLRYRHFYSNAETCLAHPFGGFYLCRYLETYKVNQSDIVSFLREYQTYRVTNECEKKVIIGQRIIRKYLLLSGCKSLTLSNIITQEISHDILADWKAIIGDVEFEMNRVGAAELRTIFDPIYRSILVFIDRSIIPKFQSLF